MPLLAPVTTATGCMLVPPGVLSHAIARCAGHGPPRARSARDTCRGGVVVFEHSCFNMRVNPTRLFILGALARHGPMYGHQLRRDARLDRTELWSDVRPGSLYGALHRLAAEGLIEPLRTEQSGNLPARTVYAITSEGLRELKTLRAEALAEVGLRPDPVDLALAMSADLDEDTLRGFVEDRIKVLG